MSESASPPASRRATLRLSLRCDNRCLFCAQAGLHGEDLSAAALAVALPALRAGHDELSFVGGEPTLSPLLAEALSRAKALGFGRLGLQSNGGNLGEAKVLPALVERGLSDLHLTVLGAEPAVHDYHTGRAGSFEAVLKALQAARAHGLLTVVTTVLTRSNFRVLATLPPLLRARGVAGWSIAVPHARGRAEAAFDRLVPRLGLAVPFALHAIESARRLGLPAWLRGAPLCTLGPLGSRALPDPEPRSFAPGCEGCQARSACPGVDHTYARRFGAGELTRQGAAATATDAPAHLERLFVGTGELAPLAGLVVDRLLTPRSQTLPVVE